MTIFAKTFVIDDTQVLIFWEYDQDQEDYELQVKTKINNIGATLNYRFGEKNDVIKCFDKFNESQVIKLINSLKQDIQEYKGENES